MSAGEPPSADSFQPQRALVVPRGQLSLDGPALPLDRLLAPILEKSRAGVVQIIAPPFSGKTTALRHLQAVLPRDRRIGYFDEPQFDHWKHAAREIIAIVTTQPENPVSSLASLHLAPWTLDDCIEYLAAVQRDRCGAIVPRLRKDGEGLARTAGNPRLLRLALDLMLVDDSILTIADALRRQIALLLSRDSARTSIYRDLLRQIKLDDKSQYDLPDTPKQIDPEIAELARHSCVREILIGEALADAICASANLSELVARVPRANLPEIAAAMKWRPHAPERLLEVLRGPDRKSDAVAASLMLALDANWRPWEGRPMRLFGATLNHAKWPKIDLQDTIMDGVSFRGADLSGAVLNRINAVDGLFDGADLREARLDDCFASNATFIGANLQKIEAENANFLGADFTDADLTRARLQKADFGLANLTNAKLTRADLRRANLKATLNETDLTRADLSRADLKHVDLRTACLNNACAVGAHMLDCNLNGCEIEFADFESADLGSAHLTGSVMREGNFRNAILRGAFLAEIDWENADLRDADLTGATFHMGSSRSGLVGSIIPCEGSKTGFYTDDYNEQDFKCPEEIRKANLCGADLRGAKIDGVDFYLVDLRGAKYTRDQAEHFARCGAILRSRAA